MSEDQLSPDAQAVEAALSTLSPGPLGISRDELIFSAAASALQRRQRRRLPWWIAGVACLTGSAAFLGAAVAKKQVDSTDGPIALTYQAEPDGQATPAARQTPADVSAATDAPAAHADMHVGFSPIWSVSHWSREELNERGITIEPCSQWCDLFSPPMEFVTIRFDCTKVPADHDVIMFTELVGADRETDLSFRSIRGAPDPNSVSLELAITEASYLGSQVTIMIWPPATEDASRSARGYHLSLNRALELARQLAGVHPGG